MPIRQRHQTISIDWADENCLEVSAHFTDNFHDIKTTIVIDCVSRKITFADARMDLVPYDLCHEVCIKMKDLVGLEVKKGVVKEINEVVGTSRGCSHLADMTVDSVKAFAQAVPLCFLTEEMSFEEKLDKIKTANSGICHTYSNLDRNPKYIGNPDF